MATLAVCFAVLLIFTIAMMPSKSAKPNIVLISIDTLRGDHFTPALMPKTYQWAKENAIIYTNCYANTTWTLPSHVTLMTGMLPHEHGVEHTDTTIPDTLPCLPGHLKQRGYHTAAFTGGGYVGEYFGFAKGFDSFWEQEARDNPNEPFEMFIKWTLPAEPYFVFLHTYFVHDYHTEAEWGGLSIPERAEKYSKQVRQMDAHLFDLLSSLPDDVLIIITSDHGESFKTKHADPPTFELTHVPLIVSGKPKMSNGLVDIAWVHNHIRDMSKPRSKKSVISEYISYTRQDGIRHTANIDRSGRHLISKTDEATAPIKSLPSSVKESLQTLGYLN